MQNKFKIYLMQMLGGTFLIASCNDIKHSKMQNCNSVEKNELQLIINSYNKKVPIKIRSNESIRDLKLKIWDKFGISIESQSLSSGNRKFTKDKQSLKEYKIYNLSEINLNLPIKGGMIAVAKIDFGCFFPHFDKNIIQYGKVCSYGCEWRTVTSGANIAAECKNKNCPSKESYVWVYEGLGKNKDKKLGIGSFNVARMANEPIYCSACGCEIAPQNLLGVGFFDCEYKIEGKRLKYPDKFPKDYTQEELTIPWIKTNNGEISKYFSKITGIWTFLELFVKPL